MANTFTLFTFKKRLHIYECMFPGFHCLSKYFLGRLAVINECRKVSHWNKNLMSDSYKNQEPGWAPVKTQRMTPVESPVGSRSQIILAVFYWKIDES